MTVRLEQLKYIIEVANCGSITVAADKLHVSQPNISYAISSLEKELEAVIFHRTRSGTETTEIGRSIIEQAQEIMNQVDILKNTARNHGSLVEGTLTIGAISGICTSFLPRTLSAFKAKYPNVDLVIHEGHSGRSKRGSSRANWILDWWVSLGNMNSSICMLIHSWYAKFWLVSERVLRSHPRRRFLFTILSNILSFPRLTICEKN